MNGQPPKANRDGVFYYPVSNPYVGGVMNRLKRNINSTPDNDLIKKYVDVIEDFKPNIIHIFGTEGNFGLLSQYTQIPIVIHLQGILNPYHLAYFPPGYSKWDYAFMDKNPLRAIQRLRGYKGFGQSAQREVEIFKQNHHFMGRTDWDRTIVGLYNPQATYDYCSEMLRDVFYEPSQRALPSKLIITTAISAPLWKGYDVILKCAKVLKEQRINFEWRVYGNVKQGFVENKEKITPNEVNVTLMGVANAKELKDSMTESTLYVHPSYIDNSPNSVCEAQMVGLPIVGQYVGGMPTIVEHGVTGFLVPANDPHQMAHYIYEIYTKPAVNLTMSENAAKIANRRHDKERIISDLMNIYYKYKKGI